MMCAWKQLMNILPAEISAQANAQGRETLQELRLRVNAPPEMITGKGTVWLNGIVRRENLDYVINGASRYSPWCAGTMAQGYITAPGGHRIGICGDAVFRDGTAGGFRRVDSLCIRVARDFPGIAQKAANAAGSILILGAPGWGKTTLLRDLSRQISQKHTVCVVDERGEVFPEGLQRGKRMDVITGLPKLLGIEMVLRAMGPEYIAVDEITAEADCLGLVQAANCGVHLIATVHASGTQDLKQRDLYRMLLEKGIFQTILQLRGDKSYCAERVGL